MQLIKFLTLLITLSALKVSSLNILGILPTPARSHYFPFDVIVRGLAAKGHNLTVISFFGRDKPVPNIEDVILPKANPSESSKEIFNINDFEQYSRLNGLHVIRNFAMISCGIDMKSAPFQQFLASNRTFDLLIIEAFNTDCYLGLVDKYKVPFVQYSSSAILPMMFERFGQPDNPSYLPTIVGGYAAPMNFWERVQNAIIHLKHKYEYFYGFVPENYELAKNVFGDQLRGFSEIANEASLLITNTHFTYTGACPNVPGIIEVGGVHVGAVKPLPNVSYSNGTSVT